jgi:signal transduction histidine kinase/ligand-binding sensor domain-containing protein/AraC-like DNA-binding protein/ActR/RegA family two-component response regulator
MRISIYFILFITLFANTVKGQLQCNIKHYSTEDGLSHDRVTCMIKDKDGFMWFGTWDGINRFDGHNFITFKSYAGDKSDLKNNRINDIVEDKYGYLWLRAYDKQVYRFDKKTNTFLGLSKILKKDKTNKFAFDKIISSKIGPVWLFTKDQGAFVIPKPGEAVPNYIRYSKDLAGDFQLPSNQFNFFTEDEQNSIWIGTPNGLCHLVPGKSGNYRKDLLNIGICKEFNFTAMTEDNTQILFTTGEGYLVSYDKISHRFVSKKIITDQKLNGVFISKKRNVIYCSTSGGKLLTLNGINWSVQSSGMVDGNPLFSIYEDKSGLVWIEPERHGVVKYDPQTGLFKCFAQKNEANFNNDASNYHVFEDAQNTVWVNMKGGGFGFYNYAKDAVDYFYDEPNIINHRFSNMVSYEYYDDAGILWLSTDDRGVEKIVFHENDFHQKNLVENSFMKPDNEVRAVYNDRENRLWLATKGDKLYIYKNGKKINDLFTNQATFNKLGQVYTILEDHNGIIWLGTKTNGLFKAEPSGKDHDKYSLTHYLADKNDMNSISSNVVYSLIEDDKGRVWAGTYEGGLNLVITKGHQTSFFNVKNAFNNYPKGLYRKVRHLAQGADGNIWIGTTDGLLILDPDHGEVKNFRFIGFNKVPGDEQSLGNNDVQFIYKDSKNTMWISTAGGGLNRTIGTDPFKSLKFKYYTTKDGLPNDYILSCIEDNNGNLWLATQKGLSEFNILNHHFRNYDSSDGLPQSGFSEATCLKLPGGNLVFGAISGYISFNPDLIINHKINAGMALTNLQINNKDITASTDQNSILKTDINNTPALTLQYNQNILSIDYSVLDFRSDGKQVYSYRLKGFDTAWNTNITTHHKATYSNLPAGSYRFQVKSPNADLYSNTPSKTIIITILPPPWRTWWAYLIYVTLAVIVFEAIRRTALTMLKLRQRITVERKLTDLKLSFFTNISHELRTPLTLILNPIEQIFQKENLSAQGIQYAYVIQKNASRMVRFINQLLDLRKVQSGKASLKISRIEVVSFVNEICEYFTELAHEKCINLQVCSNVNKLYAWVDAEKIDIVIYNILANALKFTNNGKNISISINQTESSGCFTIQVIDQGIGVPAKSLKDIFELYYESDNAPHNHLKGTGIGLALSKELVELHSGSIYATNNLEGGLTVTLEMKSGKDHYGTQNVVFVDIQETDVHTDMFLPDELYEIITQLETGMENTDLPLLLLVEDNNDLRNYLTKQLSEFYRVIEAENGQIGWEKANELIPDLVLTDIMMPVMDGIQMLDKIKNDTSTSHIPVVLLSAKFSIESQIEGLKYGADYYITKPFNNEFLLASIANLLKQRKQLFESLLDGKSKITLSPGEIIITSKDETFLKKVIQIVEDEMPDPDFNIDNFADTVGMSRTAFYKKFKSLTGMVPVEFVRDMRLKRGKQLLDGGENNMSQIAYSIGFNDAKYFSKCFKKQYNLSPSDYFKAATVKIQ